MGFKKELRILYLYKKNVKERSGKLEEDKRNFPRHKSKELNIKKKYSD